MRVGIHPSSIVEADRIDHENVSVPFTNRMAHPGWICILGMLAGVQKTCRKPGVSSKSKPIEFGRILEFATDMQLFRGTPDKRERSAVSQ
jgi:hypothetical protein